MADDFPSPEEIARIKAIQAARPQIPQATPGMISSALYGLVSNPALDRLVSGESFTSPPITPETKPGYLGPSANPWADAYMGGLLGGASLVGGPEMLIAKGLGLGAKALGIGGLKAAAAVAPKVGAKLGAEGLKSVASELAPFGEAYVASPEAVKAGIASQAKGGGPWYMGLSNEDIAHTLHGVMHTPGHDQTYIQAFEKLPQDTKSEVAGHINSLLQQSADDALKKLQGAMKPAAPAELAPGVPQHPDLPEMPDFAKTKPYDMGTHLLDLVNKQEYQKYGQVVSAMPLDYLDKMTAQIKKEGWDNIHAEALHEAEAQDPAIFGHVPGGVDELIHGTGFKPKDEGWAGYNTPKEAAEHLAMMHHLGEKEAWEQTINGMPSDFWKKVQPEIGPALEKIKNDPYAQVPFHAGPSDIANISADAISKALEKDPGASIFDVAKTKIGELNKAPELWIQGTTAERAQRQEELKDATLKAWSKKSSIIPMHGSPQEQEIARAVGARFPGFHATRATEQDIASGIAGQPWESIKMPWDEFGFHYGTAQAATDRVFGGNRYTPDIFMKGGPFYKTAPGDITGSGRDARLYPLYTRASHPLYLPDQGYWDTDKMTEALSKYSTIPIPDIKAAAKSGIEGMRELVGQHGYDIFPYINEGEHLGSVSYMVANPSLVRSPFAKFKDLQLNHILAGLAGFGVAAPAVAPMMGGQDAGASQ